jgi:hypothetical protein
MSDIIHKKNNKWYFWDESWSLEFGPFETREIASKECNRYAFMLGYKLIEDIDKYLRKEK